MKMNIKGDETCETLSADKRDIHIFKSLMECFQLAPRNSSSEVSTIQLTIRYSENKYERIIELKSTSGVSIADKYYI